MTYWFVKPLDRVCNENIMRFLRESGESDEVEEYKRKDKKGSVHKVLHIPHWCVEPLLQARKRDHDRLFRFKLFKTTHFSDDLEDAEFMGKERRPPSVKRAEGELKKHTLKHSSRNRKCPF